MLVVRLAVALEQLAKQVSVAAEDAFMSLRTSMFGSTENNTT